MSVARMAAAALVFSACAIPEEEVTTEVTQAIGGIWGGGGDDCEEWGCGQNSPEIDQLGAHEWTRTIGAVNTSGFKIKKITHDSYASHVRFNITVTGAQIGATSVDGFYTLLPGAIGDLRLHVEHTNGFHYQMKFTPSHRTAFFADYNYNDSIQPRTHTYVIEWIYDHALQGYNPAYSKEWKNICTDPQNTSDNLGMYEANAVVFEGERINSAAKTVYGYDETFFNIGCAGHALAKLHLSGYTEAAKKITNGNFNSFQYQRQAMLKMFTADYCGTGMAFTRAGEPLQWKDTRGFNRYTGTVALEARWYSGGAKCLENPRLSTTTYPSLLEDIAAECGEEIPTCMELHGNKDVNNLQGWTVNSANPSCGWFGCTSQL